MNNNTNKEKWEVGDKFTTPETGDKIFTVTRFNDYDVEAVDIRSATGFGIFAKWYITKIQETNSKTK